MTPLALIALRADGPDDDLSIREVAVARVEPFEAQPTDVYAATIRPTRRGGDPRGVWLVDAMDHVRELTRGCIVTAWDAHRLRALLEDTCAHWELLPLEIAHRTLDLRAMSWPLVVCGRTTGGSLGDVAKALGVEHAGGDGPLGEVRVAGDVYRRLVRQTPLAPPELGADERAIIETIATRIAGGRATYGEWNVDDGRDYPKEALAEIMDALNYCAAELVRLGKRGAA